MVNLPEKLSFELWDKEVTNGEETIKEDSGEATIKEVNGEEVIQEILGTR